MYLLRLFGGVSLDGLPAGATDSGLQHRSLAVLALLALARDKGCSREKLIGYLWAESDQERARHRLSDTVYKLRKSLGDEAVVLDAGDILRLNPHVVESDAGNFLDALDAGALEAAARLYDAPFLDGFYMKGAPQFERWMESERRRLGGMYSDALEQLAEQAAADPRRATEWWKRLVGHDPYNSRYVLRYMEAMARSGDPANAIQVGQEHERLLRTELAAEPVPEVLELAERLRHEAGEYVDYLERDAPLATEVDAKHAVDLPIRPRGARILLALTLYAAVSLSVAAMAHLLTLQFGLPDWIFDASVALLFACLPFVILTAFLEGVPAVKGWLSWRTTIGLIVLAFTVLGIAVSGYMVTRAMGIGPWGTLIGRGVLEERDRIVLADFEDHTGDASLALAVTEALRVDLGQSAVVRVADRAYVSQVLNRMEHDPDQALTHDLAREVAIREGLKAVATGEIHLAGSSYVVSARLVAAETGEELAAFRETAADPDGVIPSIDRLSERLRERIGESLKTIRRSPPLKQVRTTSLEALRLYTEGVRANIHQRDFHRACDLASRAIELDSLFVAAYRLRAHCQTNLGINQAQIIADATKAYELRHRLIPKEQYNSEAVYHQMVTGDMEALIHAWRRVLEIDPGWATAYNQMGGAYYVLHDYARAEEMFRRRLELDTLAAITRGGLARSQFNQGKLDEAEATLRQWEAKLPGHPDIQFIRAIFASAQGEYGTAQAHLRVMGDRIKENRLYRARTSRHLGYLAQVQGKLTEAEAHFRDAMDGYEEGGQPVGRLASAIELAGMQVWFLGDTARALQTVGAALEKRPLETIEPVDRPYPALAGLYAFVGKPERARQFLAEWEAIVPPDLRRRSEVSRRLGWASVAIAEGRNDEAWAEIRFVRARDRCPICQLPLLGRLYDSLGQADYALAVYDRYLTTPYAERCITTPYTLRALGGITPADGFDSYWLPVVYERLGALYEQRGDTVNAIRYYGKLVDLWKAADSELQPRVEAANQAIEALSPNK